MLLNNGDYMKKSIYDRIIQECNDKNKNDTFTKNFLEYYNKLDEKGLPVISSPKHFSMLVGMDHNYICSMAYSPKSFYREFFIEKSNGDKRKISEPLPDLKFVQKWILKNILEKTKVSRYAKAYIPNCSVKQNAKFHRKQRIVLSMDIKNFFPSIKIKSIVELFKSFGYLNDVACFLAYLCCYNYCLPQGAPTSPYLSNLRLLGFDKKIVDFTNPRKIRYTRYADDITLSGDFNPHEIIKTVSDLVIAEGFSINTKKTRVAYGNARQEVTGVVVNEKLQIPRTERKKIRQEVYYINKYGLDSHLSYLKETRVHYLNHLLGKLNFALYINPMDKELKRYSNQLLALYKQTADDS